MIAAVLRGHRHHLSKVAGAACLVASAATSACFLARPVSPVAGVDSVVLIVLDTFRGDIPSYAGGPASMPNLDALVQRGVWFRQGRSNAPQTGPSHATLFTSRNVVQHGVHENGQVFAPTTATLAEVLRQHGRRTAGFVSLGVLSAQFGFDRGFQEYSDDFGLQWWKDAEEMNGMILPWIEQTGTEPFFAFFHFSDTHGPYTPPDRVYPSVRLRTSGKVLAEIPANGRAGRLSVEVESQRAQVVVEPGEGLAAGARFVVHLGGLLAQSCRVEIMGAPPARDSETASLEFSLPVDLELSRCRVPDGPAELSIAFEAKRSVAGDREAYRLEAEYLDRQLGQVLAALDRSGKLARSVVVVVGDHGEGLGDHGTRRHGKQLYDSLLRVPVIFVAPGLVPAGRVVDEPVSLIDVAPTVIDLLGLPPMAEALGQSLVPLMAGASTVPLASVGRALAASGRYDLESVTWNGLKYIRDNKASAEELYDLARDPGELENLATERPEDLVALRSLLESRTRGHGVTAATNIDEETRLQLEALGYMAPRDDGGQ